MGWDGKNRWYPMTRDVEWRIEEDLVPYHHAVAYMEERVQAIRGGAARELIWLLEHPPTYTIGSSGTEADILQKGGEYADIPIIPTGRGGKATYHGPGQRIVYMLLDLRKRSWDTTSPLHRIDVRQFVTAIESWLMLTLADLGIQTERRQGRVGLWVKAGEGARGEEKIAALGLRIRRGISYHGAAINVKTDLKAYGGIIPCGLENFGVTSCHALGFPLSMADLDAKLRTTFDVVFPSGCAHTTKK